MATVQDGKRNGSEPDAVARSLAWFSVGLGAAQIAAPGAVARLTGVGDTDGRRALMRAMGIREIAAGVGILAAPHAGWLWARVAGDALDLALLGAALGSRESKRGRVAAAMAAVGGVTVADILEGTRLGSDTRETADGEVVVKKAITVNKPADDVYAFWRDFDNFPRFMSHVESVRATGDTRSHWEVKAPLGRTVAWDAEIVDDRPGELIAWRSVAGADVDNAGSVRFASAPGGRGTEIVLELRYAPPGGPLGAAAARLLGEEPEVQAHDDLRRFKQVIETGEIVRSEGSPSGGSILQHLKQRPAQPVGEAS